MEENQNNVNASGFLEVGDNHKLYYEDWGNPKANPIIHFHGGPGGGFNDSHKQLFNPVKHRVIFFDQRGSGKSTPFAEIKNNTTHHLVEDTEKLRKHLKLKKVHLVGGSWGSTMALMYAITYPEQVKSLLLWGIYLGSNSENELISAGHSRYNYPEAWERFISLVPKKHQGSGTEITQYYADKMNNSPLKVALKYADEWSRWESALLSLSYREPQVPNETPGDTSNLAVAKLETHYFLNDCFLPKNYILGNIHMIQHLPCYVVQGRFDNCTPPVTAYTLSKAYGENLTLQWVSAGHKRTDPELMAALKAIANSTM